MPADSAPLERDEIFEIVRDRLADILEIDPSTEPLLPRFDPARDAYSAAVREFGDDEVYVLAMQTDDVFRPERLHVLRRVHDAVAQMPEVRRVTVGATPATSCCR